MTVPFHPHTTARKCMGLSMRLSDTTTLDGLDGEMDDVMRFTMAVPASPPPSLPPTVTVTLSGPRVGADWARGLPATCIHNRFPTPAPGRI